MIPINDTVSYYKATYYKNQTAFRGLLDKDERARAFAKQVQTYDYYFKSLLHQNSEARILDVPCGFGNILNYLREKGFTNVLGIDNDQKQIDLCLELGLNAQKSDVFSFLKSADKSNYDMIFCVDFIEHIPKNDLFLLIEGMGKLLRNGGALILRTPNVESPFGNMHFFNDPTHEWAYTPGVLENVLSIYGFSVKKIWGEYPLPIGLKGRLRMVISKIILRLLSKACELMGFAAPQEWSPSFWIYAVKKNEN